MPEVWIQLENRPWDTMPNNIDRMTGKAASVITGKPSEIVTITSPDASGTGIRVSHTRKMYAPLRNSTKTKIIDALIFRRYKPPVQPDKSDAWTVPDDRKVNPWDINEKDPTDNGTMGTIPGPVIECNVGDTVTVHFRNLDMRALNFADHSKSAKVRTHSMHVHGFVFRPEHDGAYPLSPADSGDATLGLPAQPIPASETPLWNEIGVFGPNKIGDRVPPGATFDYTWKTLGWPSTAGVWLYHDHSICDMENMGLGAIGIVVIHNPNDTQNDFVLANADFPDSNPNGNPVALTCIRFPVDVEFNRSLLRRLGDIDPDILSLVPPAAAHDTMPGMNMGKGAKGRKPAKVKEELNTKMFKPDPKLMIQQGDLLAHFSNDLTLLRGICFKIYKTPPAKAQYVQLYHELTGAPGMCINGRTYLGNTPSVVAGTNTKMRFGVVGMGTSAGIHTFHIHGHRWIMPGPHGNTPGAIQGSVLDTPVSQFEDTRIFGPANSFVFTINGALGSFMRAGGNLSADESKGEWHMHCHVLNHMMGGMMGSLLIVGPGQAVSLPSGEECPQEDAAPAPPAQHEVIINPPSAGFPAGSFSVPSLLPVKMNDTVRFINNDTDIHGVKWLTAGSPSNSPIINPSNHWDVVMPTMGTFLYECIVHGNTMPGSITVTM